MPPPRENLIEQWLTANTILTRLMKDADARTARYDWPKFPDAELARAQSLLDAMTEEERAGAFRRRDKGGSGT